MDLVQQENSRGENMDKKDQELKKIAKMQEKELKKTMKKKSRTNTKYTLITRITAGLIVLAMMASAIVGFIEIIKLLLKK